mgnify:CR=1 FL=1
MTLLSGAEDFRLAEREVNQTQLKIEAERLTLAFNAPMEPLRLQGTVGEQPGLFADGGDLWGW